MAKQGGQKRKLAVLLAILRERTDEEHPLSMPELLSALAARGIGAERKSVYDDLETLCVLGQDVVRVGAGPATRYYLGERTLQYPEVKLLTDALLANRFLTEKQCRQMLTRLYADVSVYRRERLKTQVYVLNRLEGGNTVLYTVDALQEAIARGRQVTFRYLQTLPDGQRVPRHGGKIYAVSPFALCWDDEYYYLIAYDGAAGEIRHYRVDKMDALTVTDTPREGEAVFARFDMGQYCRATFGMFGGKTEAVTLAFTPRLCEVMFDRFGSGIRLRKDEMGYAVTVPVVVSPQFLAFVLGFGGEMKILAPAYAAEALVKTGKEALALYDPDKAAQERPGKGM